MSPREERGKTGKRCDASRKPSEGKKNSQKKRKGGKCSPCVKKGGKTGIS